MHSLIIYWSKINSTIKIFTIQAIIRFIFSGKICDDISSSTVLEGYISNNHKESMKWVYNWLPKRQSCSLMDDTLYLTACKIRLSCKSWWFSDLGIALWASKNFQTITGSAIMTFQLKNQHKPSCKSEFPFFAY